MFAGVRKAAIKSADDMKDFRESWTSQQTQDLFARSRQSLSANSDLSKSAEVAKYGWKTG